MVHYKVSVVGSYYSSCIPKRAVVGENDLVEECGFSSFSYNRSKRTQPATEFYRGMDVEKKTRWHFQFLLLVRYNCQTVRVM